MPGPPARAESPSPATRVAFAFGPAGPGWMGGVNYYRNLLSALLDEPSAGIVPVALVAPSGAGAPPVEGIDLLRTPLLDPGLPLRLARGLAIRATGRDLLLERLLEREGISALSHAHALGPRSRVPSLCWVPDLQHRHLPRFFDAAEIARRDRIYGELCRDSTLVIASSECARGDLAAFAPRSADKVRVLRFVDSSMASAPLEPLAPLAASLGIGERYLLLPNQFWAHKNHAVVVRALRILKGRGRRVVVLATGDVKDHRQPGHFAQLMRERAEAGVEELFLCPGILEYAKLATLAHHAVAIINPSLFEGWSTSVEEGKSLGKVVLLSDIPVHREQAPERGRYFAPDDAEGLAAELWRAWESFDPEAERAATAAARERLPERRRAFARAYGAFVREAVALHRGGRVGQDGFTPSAAPPTRTGRVGPPGAAASG